LPGTRPPGLRSAGGVQNAPDQFGRADPALPPLFDRFADEIGENRVKPLRDLTLFPLPRRKIAGIG